jgi:hypothetical protein
MASIAASVRMLKERAVILNHQWVDQVCSRHGHLWRDRELPPGVTLELFLRQVMEGNCSCQEVRLLGEAPGSFTGSAYCQARARLPAKAVWEVVREATGQFSGWQEKDSRWHGHRTFHVDGTGFSMPDTPELQASFGQPGMQKKGCGFPVAHLLVLFDAQTGLVLEAYPGPLRTHDLKDIARVHPHLSAGDVLVGDKAFGSWGHLAMLAKAGVHGLFPMHQKRRREGKSFDRIERWAKPQSVPAWMTAEEYAALPEQITVRVVRQQVKRGKGWRPVEVTLVTTLLDPKAYPADELVGLGRGRWDAETNFRHLKITLGLDVLKCRTLDGVLKELAMFVLAYNVVRVVMIKAAERQGTTADRISFKDTLAWLCRMGVEAELKDLIRVPCRPGRREPRAIKRRNDNYARMTQPRAVMRKELK